MSWELGVCWSKLILGPWWGPRKVFYGYVNGHWVGILLQGGGDT